jgi:hypothetical protein
MCRHALLVLAAMLGGCGDDVINQSCMSMGIGGVAQQAALLSLDDYGAAAHCDGDRAQAGAIPLSTHRFVAGDPITLQLPPGAHTLVLWAFADTDGNQLLGSACTEKTLAAGAQICLDLSLDPAGDGGLPSDLSGVPLPPDLAGVPCDVTCGGICCRNLNATCGSDCSVTCASAFADCDSDPADGCERPTNTVSSCSGCGLSCDTVHTTGAMCSPQGLTCTYDACAAGRVDCAKNAPNLDGCECEGNGCCGTGCQVKHTDGTSGGSNGNSLGDSFYDCVPVGTHNLQQATEAGLAFDPNGTWDPVASPTTPHTYTDSKGTETQVCMQSTTKGSCACFCYDATGSYANFVGRVVSPGKGATTCYNINVGQPANYPQWN